MFLAIRDLMFAKGRFLLMGIVVALVSLLVTTLSGLSAGLIKANISGLMALPATHVRNDLRGLNYTFADKGLAEHPKYLEWLETVIAEIKASL